MYPLIIFFSISLLWIFYVSISPKIFYKSKGIHPSRFKLINSFSDFKPTKLELFFTNFFGQGSGWNKYKLSVIVTEIILFFIGATTIQLLEFNKLNQAYKFLSNISTLFFISILIILILGIVISSCLKRWRFGKIAKECRLSFDDINYYVEMYELKESDLI